MLKESESFKKEDIKIVQIGASGEETISGVDLHLPTATLKQCAFLIKHALAHIGTDSVPVHLASALDIPVVSLYAHTWKNSCAPIWHKNSGAIQIESNRGGKKPSFSLEENPKTINLIYPEEVVNGLFDVMRIEESAKEKTHYIGCRFGRVRYDVIPEHPFCSDQDINVRMDFVHNEDVLLNILQQNPATLEITIKKPFNPAFLPSDKIRFINYFSEDFDADFVHSMKSAGKEFAPLCTNKEALLRERAKLFDFPVSYYDEGAEIEKRKNESGLEGIKNPCVRTMKRVVCGEQVYNTLYEYSGDKKDFWLELDWYRIYTQ